MHDIHPPRVAAGIPAAMAVSDDRLRLAADKALRGSGYASMARLDVEVTRGHITISGTVPSFYLKQIAQAVVMKLDGAQFVENRLIVAQRRPAHAYT
jgi:osmotically-inducible protein OsmY